MASRSPAAPHAAASLSPTPCPPLPADLDYQVLGLLPTDSQMSEILLATDRQAQTVILKIACVQQRARAETNRRAIHNSVVWLQQLGGHRGVAQMQPIQRKGATGLLGWFTPPTFVATLPAWPGNPDFLVSEYLPGGTLSHFVGKQPLPIELALSLAYVLARTVADLHAQACVHRDLKPENILFRFAPSRTARPGELQPVLIDFGVAARVGEPKLISGSRLWMAPELQTADEKTPQPVDPAWDVYALGLICCYMLAGLRPRRQQYDAQDYIDYRNQVFAQLQQATPTPGAGQALVALLQPVLSCALAQEPRNRPTAAEFAEALAAVLTQIGVRLPQEATGFRRWYRYTLARCDALWKYVAPNQPWRVAGFIALILIVLIFLAWFLGGDSTASRPDQSQPQPLAGVARALPAVDRLKTGAQAPVKPRPSATTVQLSLPLASPTLPPPTLAALPTKPLQPIPTLAVAVITPKAAPPTLAQLRPTRTPPPPAPAPTPILAVSTPRQRQPTATASRAIRLRTPPTHAAAAQERVEFAWTITGAALVAEHCAELVFWDPANSQDKRSPTGAGRAQTGTVNFSKLRESPDALLRSLARNPQGFDWGVRVVVCAAPKTVVQDVSETRHYTYQP